MGNSIRRSNNNERSVTDFSEVNIARLINEKKLAPKSSGSPDSKRSEECPICFLEFDSLNKATCCKQNICTDCFCQLKQPSKSSKTTPAPSCPFCNRKEFDVTYTAGSTGNDENKNSSSSCKSADSTKRNHSTSGGATAFTYTTPEQERRLRSHSLHVDSDSSSASTSSSKSIDTQRSASKSDRAALEQQIRSQRLRHSEEECNAEISQCNAAGSPGRENRRFPDAFPGRFSIAQRSDRDRSERSFLRPAYRSPQRPSAQSSPGVVRSQQLMSARQSHLFDSIQGILGNSGLEGISSIEQLEELMLMEAIRQSMSINTSSESVNSAPSSAQTAPLDSIPVLDNTQGTSGPLLDQTNGIEPTDRESVDLNRALDAIVIDDSVSTDANYPRTSSPVPAFDEDPTEAAATRSSVVAPEDPLRSDSIELLMPDDAAEFHLEDEEQMRLALALSVADIDTAADHH